VFRKLVASDVSCPKKQLGSSTTLKKEKPVKRQLESMVADLCTQKEKLVKREHGPTVVTELHATAEELQQKQWDQGNSQFLDISLDLSRGNEAYPIRVVNESNSKSLPPSFFYISKSEVHQDAHVNSSLTRIGDDHCCPSCKDNCLTADFPCACARETGGEFAYTRDGCLADRYLAKVYKVVKII
jgi:DNA polymerase IIIc chi subunit